MDYWKLKPVTAAIVLQNEPDSIVLHVESDGIIQAKRQLRVR